MPTVFRMAICSFFSLSIIINIATTLKAAITMIKLVSKKTKLLSMPTALQRVPN